MSAADRFSLRRPSRVLAAILVVAVGVWAGPAGAGNAKDKEKPPANGAPADPGNGNGNGNGKDKPKDDGAPNNGNGNGGGRPGGPVVDTTGDPAAPAPEGAEASGDDTAEVGHESNAFSRDDDPAQAALGSNEDDDASQSDAEGIEATPENDVNGGTEAAGPSAPAPAPTPKAEQSGRDPKPTLPPPGPAPSQAPIPTAPNWTQPTPLAAPAAKPKAKATKTHDQRVLGRWHSSNSNASVVRGVNGAAAVEVTTGNAKGRFTLVTTKPLVADRIPYRVNAWLRTDTPGLTVCLRFVEKQPGWKGKRVRSSETCIAPTTEWKRYRVDALSVARGNVLRVAAVVYGSFGDASFELSRLKVEKKVDGRWTKLRGAKLTSSS